MNENINFNDYKPYAFSSAFVWFMYLFVGKLSFIGALTVPLIISLVIGGISSAISKKTFALCFFQVFLLLSILVLIDRMEWWFIPTLALLIIQGSKKSKPKEKETPKNQVKMK